MKKDAKVFIHHILESISLIEVYSNEKGLEDFVASTSVVGMTFLNASKRQRPQD
ncbi:MAG: hypothetical protein NTY37_10365 [Methanothrix sp.]|nr:hypothetical protein [Methanothrix sp.]